MAETWTADMEMDPIVTEFGDISPAKPSPATSSVLGTYELLETIILALPAEDVLRAATKVNKNWHNVTISSISINKHLISSPFVVSELRDRCSKAQRRHRIADITYVDFFWGDLIIKQHGDKELIYVRDSSGYDTFEPQFLSGDENVGNLTKYDHDRLKHGWANAFMSEERQDIFDEFRCRFEMALYAYLHPKHGEMAQQLWTAWNVQLQDSTLSYENRMREVSHWFRAIWQDRTKCTSISSWELDVRTYLRTISA